MATVLIPMTHREVVQDLGITYQRIHHLINRAKVNPFNVLPNGLIIPDAKYQAYKEQLLAESKVPEETHQFVKEL